MWVCLKTDILSFKKFETNPRILAQSVYKLHRFEVKHPHSCLKWKAVSPQMVAIRNSKFRPTFSRLFLLSNPILVILLSDFD